MQVLNLRVVLHLPEPLEEGAQVVPDGRVAEVQQGPELLGIPVAATPIETIMAPADDALPSRSPEGASSPAPQSHLPSNAMSSPHTSDVRSGGNPIFVQSGYEYFDVWAPEIATHYGEVFWTDQGEQLLPAAIVERFKGKVLAITGYEQDQVMVVPTGKPGVNPDQDVSVPINWAYNHHCAYHRLRIIHADF